MFIELLATTDSMDFEDEKQYELLLFRDSLAGIQAENSGTALLCKVSAGIERKQSLLGSGSWFSI